ncbi:MAG: radical SAM family heme chaperone HemW, partial [Deltaproteobacteria bacterium]|nr:radical SAM family heme chaperone HemW [Deltaproteobacteria bacterium]
MSVGYAEHQQLMASLYLHIPFCKTKCCYCDFNSSAAKKALHGPYLAALEREIAGMAMGRNRDALATLFIGGGTPTVLTPIQLVHLIKQAEGLFGFTGDIEISLEANPGTVSEGDLIALREGGVNRLSFGVQSFNDSELRTLGRCHTRREAEQAVTAAHQAGFKNINLDLMYGLPGQDCDSWQRSLDTAISLTPKHLSLYQLTVEPATPLEDYIDTGKLSLPDEDGILEMDSVTKQFCQEAGMKRYEISNYAEEGFECRHNVNYWRNEEYLAAGAGSVSYLK